MSTLQRWRGLKALVQDSVDSVSRSVERVHKETSKRWFDVIEAVPPVAGPTRVVRSIHDASVTGVHEIIRMTNRVVGAVADGVLDALENVEAKKQQAAGDDAAQGEQAASGERESGSAGPSEQAQATAPQQSDAASPPGSGTPEG